MFAQVTFSNIQNLEKLQGKCKLKSLNVYYILNPGRVDERKHSVTCRSTGYTLNNIFC